MMEKIKAGEITGQTGDYMLRATAANGQIRAFAATSRDLVEKARQAHNTSPVATAALGRLMTAGVMMGSMMKADSDLLTIRVEGDGPIGGLTVTADKNGNVKGYAFHPVSYTHLTLPTTVSTLLNMGMTPEDILELILGQFGLEILDKMPIQFTCNCTKSRVEKALISIGREEIGNMIADGETIEVKCHFCNKGYHFSIPELKGLLEKCGNK